MAEWPNVLTERAIDITTLAANLFPACSASSHSQPSSLNSVLSLFILHFWHLALLSAASTLPVAIPFILSQPSAFVVCPFFKQFSNQSNPRNPPFNQQQIAWLAGLVGWLACQLG